MSRALTILVLVLSNHAACATTSQSEALAETRRSLANLDEFGALLVRAGLPAEWLPVAEAVSVRDAARLRLLLGLLAPTVQTYSPRFVAETLLREVEAGGQPVRRYDLSRRIQAFAGLQVLTPYGHIATALTGQFTQCVGPVDVRDGTLRSGAYELGVFYTLTDKGTLELVEPPFAAEARR